MVRREGGEEGRWGGVGRDEQGELELGKYNLRRPPRSVEGSVPA